MTKREPFAECRTIGIVVGGVGILTAVSSEKEKRIVDEINAAFEKAVRERLEEFRVELIEKCEAYPTCASVHTSSLDALIATNVKSALLKIISNMPLEEE